MDTLASIALAIIIVLFVCDILSRFDARKWYMKGFTDCSSAFLKASQKMLEEAGKKS